MTIAAQLQVLKKAADDFAAANGGTAEIAHDLNHLFALLSIKPGGFRIALMWDQEEKRGELEEAGFVDDFFRVCIGFGRSLKLDKGEAFVTGAAGGKPYAEIIETLRDKFRGLAFDPNSSELHLNYYGAFKLTDLDPNFTMDGWWLKLSLGNQLPAPQ